jgi:hypothetical protein
MAGTLIDSWRLAFFVDNVETPDAEVFRRKVQAAVVRRAKLIAGESQGTLKLEQWQKRAALAATVLGTQLVGDPPVAKSGSEVWLDAFSMAVAENPSITSASSDGDIEFTVDASWDDLSGVTGLDLDLTT